MKSAKQVIITGLPRSGTSVTAGIVNLLGINLGQVDSAPAEPHPTGTYEDIEISNFNNKKVTLFPEYGAQGPVEFTLDDDSLSAVREMIKRKAEDQTWGCKDPRITFMMGVWAKACSNPYFIITYRNKADYIDAIRRYATNIDPEKYYDLVMPLQRQQIEYLKILSVPYLVVSFNQLVKDPIPQAKQIAEFLNLRWSKKKEKEINKLVIRR